MRVLKKKVISIISLLFVMVSLFLIIINTSIIHTILEQQVKNGLTEQTHRIQGDIKKTNAQWNMSRYNADPQIPDANSVYVIANDGFMLDRWKPIQGFLDTSDFSKLSVFTSPTTLTTPSNQIWRMYSLPIQNGNSTLGVISVGYFSPNQDNKESIDTTLVTNAHYIRSLVSIKASSIFIKNIDPRNINYDISYQVVDHYNQIITKNNNNNSIDRIPNYIDASYVAAVLKKGDFQTISDTKSSIPYLVFSQALHDANNNVIGVIVVGKSINFIQQAEIIYIPAEAILFVLLYGIFLSCFYFFIPSFLFTISESKQVIPRNKSIFFNKKTTLLTIFDKEVSIPFGTNQYYFCELLFSNPQRKWEHDEIMEVFGDGFGVGNKRKVYDTMVSLNKKTQSILDDRLILVQNKQYCINPILIDFVIPVRESQ